MNKNELSQQYNVEYTAFVLILLEFNNKRNRRKFCFINV